MVEMDVTAPLIQALAGWAQEHGTSLAPDVEVYQDPVTGLSFRARQNIPPGTKMVDCSFRTTLSYLNTIELCSSFQTR